jgi:hypothetical protein
MKNSISQKFSFLAPTAKSVYLHGSWDSYDGCPLAADKTNDHVWSVTVDIPITITAQPSEAFVQKYYYYVRPSFNSTFHF